ncbi:hypothetical protein BC830DRAFT_1057967, partial [Chytriomyces sp. MP71]
GKTSPRVSHAVNAAASFPVGPIHRILKVSHRSKRIGGGALVYVAAVPEYLAADTVAQAKNAPKSYAPSSIGA